MSPRCGGEEPHSRQTPTRKAAVVPAALTVSVPLVLRSLVSPGPRLPLALAGQRSRAAMTAVAQQIGSAIRPFSVDVPEEDLVDLGRRITATRWPDRETVPDRSQGAQLAELQELVRYWGTDYDWRRAEAQLNAWPQFMTGVDGVDVHFFHVRSRHENALPLIISHGWPGSVFEQIKVIGPLTDPTAHGGSAEGAFDVGIPSLPGFGLDRKSVG